MLAMRLKESILTESHYTPVKQTRWTFFRKVQVSLTLAIIASFLFIGSIVVVWQYLDIKHQLETQGEVLALNLGVNAEPFIVDYDKDQLNQFLDGMLGNPLVLFSGIINTRFTEPIIDVLKKQESVDLKFVTSVVRQPNYRELNRPKSMRLNIENQPIQHVIFCISPIFSDFQFPDDETTLLYNQPKHKGIIGHSVIAYRMPWEQLFSVQLQWVIVVFVVFSIVCGWLLGRVIANHFIQRIRHIHHAIQGYSFGEVVQLNDTGTDEISDIAQSIQGLTELVSVQLNKIVQTNNSLEQTVQERLVDIQQLNHHMSKTSNTQRSFFGQSLQEIQSLVQMMAHLPMPQKDTLQQHLAMVLERMVQMAKKNTPFMALGPVEVVSFPDVLNDLNPLFLELCRHNNNIFTMDVSNCRIESDAVQLRQAMIQLVHNASKYTKNGTVSVNVYADGTNAFIVVSDTGVGMSQDKLNDVLTQLDQDDLTTIDAFSTLGLGLVLVHRFCRNINAKLICSSEKLAGTRIEIIHPLTAKAQHALSGMAMCLSNDPTKIVDIKMIIQSIPGWDCDTFFDGASFDANAPGLVVVDASALNDELPRLDQLKQAFPAVTIIVFYESSFIVVAHIAEKQVDSLSKAIGQLYQDNASALVAVGKFEGSFIEKVSKAVGAPISTQYNYRVHSPIKIVPESAYHMSSRSTNSVLVYNDNASLIELIQTKGWPLAQLPTLQPFAVPNS
jgi:signal transduction histidine kinase